MTANFRNKPKLWNRSAGYPAGLPERVGIWHLLMAPHLGRLTAQHGHHNLISRRDISQAQNDNWRESAMPRPFGAKGPPGSKSRKRRQSKPARRRESQNTQRATSPAHLETGRPCARSPAGTGGAESRSHQSASAQPALFNQNRCPGLPCSMPLTSNSDKPIARFQVVPEQCDQRRQPARLLQRCANHEQNASLMQLRAMALSARLAFSSRRVRISSSAERMMVCSASPSKGLVR